MSTSTNDRYRLGRVVDDRKRLERFHRYMDPSDLVLGGQVEPRWMLDGESFWYADRTSHGTVIIRVDGKTGKAAPLLDGDHDVSVDDYRTARSKEGQADSEFNTAILKTYGMELKDRLTPRPSYRPKLFRETTLVTETPSPDRRWFASLKNGNIVLRAPVDDMTVALTTDAEPRFGWDLEAPRSIWRAGLQLEQRMLDPWSPDGLWLFAIKVDCRAVRDQPFVHYLKREEEVAWAKINRAGGPMDIAHPHVIDVLSKRTRRFDLGETEDQFFTLVGWLPNGSEVLFTRHSRDFKSVELLAGNPRDGTVRTVLSETAKTFVALQHDVIFGGDNHATILGDSSSVIWRSSRSGWNHLYLHRFDDSAPRALTQGDFPVIDVAAVDDEAGWIYFTAHHDQSRPYDMHLCRVKLAGGKLERLTPLDGQNVVTLSPNRKTFTVVNSRPDRPFRTDFHSCDGKHLATVQQADVSGLEAIGSVLPEEFSVTAADGKTPLWGVMYKPADFDPKKRYPVIDHLYGGPQVAKVVRHFGLGDNTHDHLDRALAQLGYIVICVDARGTPERSKAFQDVVYRNWGRHEIADHAAALRELAGRHAFIDLDRAGVWGHSWGGYFTLRALMQEPDLYRVGVSVTPGTDPYDIILHEPYLDLPTRSKDAYDYASLYPLAGNIKGELLLVAGTADPMCYYNTLEMSHYLIQAGVDHELVVLPEAAHYFEGANDEYFVHKLVTHFLRHLKP